MNEITLGALKKSIEKWERSVEAGLHEITLTIGSCPLCMLFHPQRPNSAIDEIDCRRCPVMRRVGRPFCRNTPFKEAHMAANTWYFVDGSADGEKRAPSGNQQCKLRLIS